MKRHSHDGGVTWHEHGPGEPGQLVGHDHDGRHTHHGFPWESCRRCGEGNVHRNHDGRWEAL